MSTGNILYKLVTKLLRIFIHVFFSIKTSNNIHDDTKI